MKTYNLIINSKNQKSLFKFVDFLNKNLVINFNYLKKSIKKKTGKKVITILKSPHVNKKAQEQFEIRLFSKQLKIDTTQTLKLLVFLKKINIYLFPDINIKIKFYGSINKKNLLQKKILNPDNLNVKKVIKTYKNIELKKLKKIRAIHYKKISNAFLKNQTLFKMFDAYGKY